MENLPPDLPTPPASASPPPVPPSSDTETRNWLMGLHLSPIVGIWIGGVGSILAPLVIWLVKKDSSTEIDAQGKQALNFQISILIYSLVSGMLMMVAIGFLLLPAVFFLWLYGMIKAAVNVNNGAPVSYPLAIPFLK